MGVILVILALVAGYFFIKKYDAIEKFLFGRDDEDYVSAGLLPVVVCAFFGAIMGAVPMLESIFNTEWQSASICFVCGIMIVLVLSYNVFDAVVRMSSTGTVLGKILFATVACIIGAAVGAAGAIVVICIVIVVAIIFVAGLLLGGAAGGGKSSKSVTLEDGTVLSNSKGICGEDNFSDSGGSSWSKTGSDTYSKD